MQPGDASDFHDAELRRINRIAGQVKAVQRMIEERKYCPEILIQIGAAKTALSSLQSSLLQRHLGHCVQHAMRSGNAEQREETIAELLEIIRKL